MDGLTGHRVLGWMSGIFDRPVQGVRKIYRLSSAFDLQVRLVRPGLLFGVLDRCRGTTDWLSLSSRCKMPLDEFCRWISRCETGFYASCVCPAFFSLNPSTLFYLTLCLHHFLSLSLQMCISVFLCCPYRLLFYIITFSLPVSLCSIELQCV